MLDSVDGLSNDTIERHGLYGAELNLKIGLWLESRIRVIAELRNGEELAAAEPPPSEVPTFRGIQPEGPWMPRKMAPKGEGKVRRALRRIAVALGHADNWLDSLIAAMGQHERLKEIKETMERAAGDSADSKSG